MGLLVFIFLQDVLPLAFNLCFGRSICPSDVQMPSAFNLSFGRSNAFGVQLALRAFKEQEFFPAFTFNPSPLTFNPSPLTFNYDPLLRRVNSSLIWAAFS